jgi:hypothetical protein
MDQHLPINEELASRGNERKLRQNAIPLLACMFKKPPLERSRAVSPLTKRAESRKDAQKEIEDLLRLKTKIRENFGPDGLQGATLRRYE